MFDSDYVLTLTINILQQHCNILSIILQPHIYIHHIVCVHIGIKSALNA